jgi:hypothetical protein
MSILVKNLINLINMLETEIINNRSQIKSINQELDRLGVPKFLKNGKGCTTPYGRLTRIKSVYLIEE